jgi:hypothetical protein
MKKLDPKYMKVLKLIHIVSASLWFGATACIGVLAAICFSRPDLDSILQIAPLIPELYSRFLLPVGLFTMLQGLFYGVFTKWGFFKQTWLLCKWILTAALCVCIGVGAINNLFSAIAKLQADDLVGGMANAQTAIAFIVAQILLILTIFILSVFKPQLKKAK